MDHDPDDIPQLSRNTLAALQEFYAEKEVQEKQFEDLKSAVEGDAPLSMEMFSEDWNSSQFWNDDDTAITLAKEMLNDSTDDTSIAVVSAPSVFIQIKNLLMSGSYDVSPTLRLLEFDTRFDVFKEFIRYDFNSPLNLPVEMKGAFDRIVCDPPFLSDDCQTKAAMTVRWLSRKSTSKVENSPRVVVCTGERMANLIAKIYPGTGITTFRPKSGLSNEFRCYANYECDAWQWINTDAQ